MSIEGQRTQKFLCTWKIENLNSIPDRVKFRPIVSPLIRIESFDESEWELHLIFRKVNAVLCLSCNLYLDKLGEFSQSIHVRFRFHLLRPNGAIFKTSQLFSETFRASVSSEYFDLIADKDLRQEISNWPTDTFTLCCHMESVQDLMPFNLCEDSVTGCQIETKIFGYDSSFIWPVKFSNLKGWSANKLIKLENFPLIVTFKYVNNDIQMYIFGNVKDKWNHVFFCNIKLLDEKDSVMKIMCDTFSTFSSKKKIWKVPNALLHRDLEKNKRLLVNEIKVVMDILYYLSHSVVNYCNINFMTEEEKRENNKIKGALKLINGTLLRERFINSEEDCVLCLQKDLRNLLVDKKMSDVKLRVDNEILTAHKILLAARSPVFSAMFNQDMSESNTGIVNILDVDTKTFSSFLEYIYSGSVEGLDEEMALNLLLVADKYQVLPLVKKCSAFLKSVLSPSNACKVLLTADMVNEDELKSFAKQFILKNSTSVLSSQEWSKLIKMNNTLATELLFLISKRLDEETKNFKISSPFSTQSDVNEILSVNAFAYSNPIEPENPIASVPSTSNIEYKLNFSSKSTECTWECSSCWVRNPDFVKKCKCCENPREVLTTTPKIFSAAPVSSSNAFKSSPATLNPSSNDELPNHISSALPVSTTGLGFTSVKPTATWACGGCLVSNPATAEKCLCCEASCQSKGKITGSTSKESESTNSSSNSTFGSIKLPMPSNSQSMFNFSGLSNEKKQTTLSGFSFGTPSQGTKPRFNINIPASFNYRETLSSTGPFQFVESCASSQTASSGPRKIRKSLRRMK